MDKTLCYVVSRVGVGVRRSWLLKQIYVLTLPLNSLESIVLIASSHGLEGPTSDTLGSLITPSQVQVHHQNNLRSRCIINFKWQLSIACIETRCWLMSWIKQILTPGDRRTTKRLGTHTDTHDFPSSRASWIYNFLRHLTWKFLLSRTDRRTFDMHHSTQWINMHRLYT